MILVRKLLMAGMVGVAAAALGVAGAHGATPSPTPSPSVTPNPSPSPTPVPATTPNPSTSLGPTPIAPAAGSQGVPNPTCGDGGTGVNSLMPRPCIQDGNQPNLTERYPGGSYSFDVDWAQLATNSVVATATTGYVDPNMVWNGIAGGVLTALVWVGTIAVSLLEWVFQVDLVGGAGGLISAVNGTLGAHVFWALAEVMIILTALWVLWHGLLRQRLTVTLEGFGWAAAAVAVATLYLAAPTAVPEWLNAQTAGASKALVGAIGGADPTLAQQPTIYGQGDRGDAALRAAADRYWQVYVYVPWTVGEFGSVSAGSQLGELKLKANTTGDASAFQDKLKQVEASNPSVASWYQGKHGGDRAALAVVSLIVLLLATVLLLALALGVLMAQLGLVALSMVAPLFFVLGIPPWGRRIFVRWAELILGAAVSRLVVAAVLGVWLVIGSLISQTVDSKGWFLAGVLQMSLVVALWMYRRPLMHLMRQSVTPRRAVQAASKLQGTRAAAHAMRHGQAALSWGQGRLTGARAGGRQGQGAAAGAATAKAAQAGQAAGRAAKLAKGVGVASAVASGALWTAQKGQGLRRGLEDLAAPLVSDGEMPRSRPLPPAPKPIKAGTKLTPEQAEERAKRRGDRHTAEAAGGRRRRPRPRPGAQGPAPTEGSNPRPSTQVGGGGRPRKPRPTRRPRRGPGWRQEWLERWKSHRQQWTESPADYPPSANDDPYPPEPPEGQGDGR